MIEMFIPGLPVSIDRAFVQGVNKKTGKPIRVMSVEAREYVKNLPLYFNRYRRELLTIRPNVPYLLLVRLHMEDLLTGPRAKFRFKRLDGSNHIKLLEDALAQYTGVDDSHNLVVIAQKVPLGADRPAAIRTTKGSYTAVCMFDLLHEAATNLHEYLQLSEYKHLGEAQPHGAISGVPPWGNTSAPANDTSRDDKSPRRRTTKRRATTK